MNQFERLEAYLGETKSQDTMQIPEIWNKYIDYEDYKAVAEHIIEVNVTDFYRFVLKRIRELHDEINTDVKDSQIYCAMPRYTMAWDIHNEGSLSGGTLLRMLILLPVLKEMKINVLYLLPITEYSNRNKKGDIGSPFAIKDFYKLDPNLHDALVDGLSNFTLDDEFHVLVQAAHLIGIRIVIDFIPRVTARDSNIIKEHPDWVYWIKKEYEKDFVTPEIPGLDFFQECTPDNLRQVYEAESTKHHLKQFVLPPNEQNPEEWARILHDADTKGEDVFALIEERLGMTTPPGHSDWINDVQPIWTDITFWKLFLDNNELAQQYVDADQPPYVMFDTIKANKFPAKRPNQELWNLFTDVLEYYAKEFQLDGFRFDIGHTLPKELLETLFEKVREYVEHPIFISEDLFNRNHESARKTGYNIMLGSSWKEVGDIKKQSYETFIRELSEMKIQAYACAETHDTPRIVTRKGGICLARGLAIVNAFLPNGVHFILSGYEINEKQPMNCGLADNTGGAKIDKAFFNNISMDWTSRNAYEMLDYLIKVNQTRDIYKDRIEPERMELLGIDEKCIAFAYGKELLVVFNLDFENQSQFYAAQIPFDEYDEVINSAQEEFGVILDGHTIQLPPAGAALLCRRSS
ncbi:MAG: alpha amylase C-terminal domain-containing protein [Lachnospiraceae bacterium]|nr:alpha amylase C-terminal domain-containing protein [Lachnospiraceae bacterium]